MEKLNLEESKYEEDDSGRKERSKVNLRGKLWRVMCKIEDIKEEMLLEHDQNKGQPARDFLKSCIVNNRENNAGGGFQDLPGVEQIDSEPIEDEEEGPSIRTASQLFEHYRD
jgi:hypothetical protein